MRTTAARVCCVADLRGSCHDGSWRMDGGGKDSKTKAGLISGRRFQPNWPSLPALTRIPSQSAAREKKIRDCRRSEEEKKSLSAAAAAAVAAAAFDFCSGFLSGRRRSAPRSCLSLPCSVHGSRSCHCFGWPCRTCISTPAVMDMSNIERKTDPTRDGVDAVAPSWSQSITFGSVPALSAPKCCSLIGCAFAVWRCGACKV